MQNIPWFEHRLDLNTNIPDNAAAFSGMVLMGGPMSVNDDLPWIPPLVALIESAFRQDIPVMGHCLGGQLMSKALGATVVINPVKEVGWGTVTLGGSPLSKVWFGDHADFLSFHWHSETFSLPAGATHVLASQHCDNQAYVIGKHLAMQCHIEMTVQMVTQWCDIWLPSLAKAPRTASIQNREAILSNINQKVAALQLQANHTYQQWVKGLAV